MAKRSAWLLRASSGGFVARALRLAGVVIVWVLGIVILVVLMSPTVLGLEESVGRQMRESAVPPARSGGDPTLFRHH